MTNFFQTKCCITEKLGIITGEARKNSISNGRIEKIDPSITMVEIQKRKETLPHTKYLGMCNRFLAKINLPSIEDIKYKEITYNFTPKDLTPDLYLPNNSQDILASMNGERR